MPAGISDSLKSNLSEDSLYNQLLSDSLINLTSGTDVFKEKGIKWSYDKFSVVNIGIIGNLCVEDFKSFIDNLDEN
jgi:hypothetical protein